MKLGRLEIKAQRWPWQENYDWRGVVNCSAPLNWTGPGKRGARFGAGWNYKLGISIGGRTVLLDLLFGMIRISWK